MTADPRPFTLVRRSPEDVARLAQQERAAGKLAEQIGRIIRDADTLEDAGAQIVALGDAKAIGADLLDEMARDALKNSPEGQSA